MKAWKVFRKAEGKYLSAVVEGKARIIYFPGKKIYARKWLREKGYNPTVFKTKKSAENFRAHRSFCEVHRVVCGKEIKLKKICDIDILEKGKLEPIPIYEWPKGTVMVEWVMLPEIKKEMEK